MSNVLQASATQVAAHDASARKFCTVDLLSATILAALVVKLFLMQVDGGGLDPDLPLGQFAKLLVVSLSSHLALFLGLLGVCLLVGRTTWRSRGFALTAHAAILGVAYLDFLLGRYQGFHASYVQFGLSEEGLNALPTLFSLCRPIDLLLLIDFPIYALLLIFLNTSGWTRRAPRGLSLACLAWFLAWNAFLFAWVGMKEERFLIWNSSVTSLPAAARKFTYPVREALNVLFVLTNRAEPYDLPREIPATLPTSTASGPPRTPHLLFLQIESLPAGAIEWDLDGAAVMPFLREFAAQGTYYRNALSTKMAGGSFDADLGVLTGFHPPESSNPYAYHLKHPPYFPHLLLNAGYTNRTYCNHIPEFMRSSFNHAQMGIEKFISIRDRVWKTKVHRLGVPGPGDREFLAFVRDDLQQAKTPSFYMVRTVTNHGPWHGLDEFDEVRETIGTEFPGDATMRGLASGLRYDDIALRQMLTPLLPKIEAGELVVVLYGDHGIGIRLQEDNPPGVTEREALVRHVPLIFVGKGIPPREDRQIVSISDVPATLANFLGLRFAKGDLGGRDLFAPGPLPPLVTPWGVFDDKARQPHTDEQRSLLRYGYGKMGAPQ